MNIIDANVRIEVEKKGSSVPLTDFEYLISYSCQKPNIILHGPGTQAPFKTTTPSLNLGDTLDFMVGHAAASVDGSVGLEVNVSPL